MNTKLNMFDILHALNVIGNVLASFWEQTTFMGFWFYQLHLCKSTTWIACTLVSWSVCLNILRTAPQYLIWPNIFRLKSAMGQHFCPWKQAVEILESFTRLFVVNILLGKCPGQRECSMMKINSMEYWVQWQYSLKKKREFNGVIFHVVLIIPFISFLYYIKESKITISYAETTSTYHWTTESPWVWTCTSKATLGGLTNTFFFSQT